MGKIYTQIIDTFNGGISEDKRLKSTNKFSFTKHFDTFTYPHKLVPYPQTAALTGEDKDLGIVRFIFAPDTAISSTAYRLYGLGVRASGKTAIYTRDLTSGTDTTWRAAAGYSSTIDWTPATDSKIFFNYKNYIYIWQAGTTLDRYNTNSESWPGAYKSIPYINACQPVHHPSDDTAYFFHDNVVAKLDNVSWTDDLLTFPTDLKIVGACAYGNYLAIACTTIDTISSKSTIFLWDMDSTLADLTERIDVTGEIKHIACLDNKLIFLTYCNNFVTKDKLLVQTINGQSAFTLNEITTDTADGIVLYDTRFVKNNRLYFPMKAILSSDNRMGIWVVNSSGNITLDFVNIDADATSYQDIYNTGDYWFIAHSGDGSTDASSATGAYSALANGLYESLIFNGGDSGQTKKLISVGVMTEPLPASGQVSVEYRVDNETSWTSALYSNTLSSLYKEANKTYVGANFPQFREIQFRLYSQSGAIITGLKFKWEEIDKEL